jgi:hypothetical protein
MPVSRIKGKYRKKLRKYFPKKRYHRRSLAETVNFVEKIKMGDELTNTKWLMKKKKQRVKDIVYNIYRYMKVSSMVLFVSTVGFCTFSYLVRYRRKLHERISTKPQT